MISASIESRSQPNSLRIASAAETHRSLLHIESPDILRVVTPAMPTTLRTSSCENAEQSVVLLKLREGTQVPIAAIVCPVDFKVAIYKDSPLIFKKDKSNKPTFPDYEGECLSL